ncbi:MAG: histidinol dehydrogenase [Crocinitomicaceae bacterium]|nr:histidinol dehydrogenase [Crocinitomicaceae bacterium]
MNVIEKPKKESWGELSQRPTLDEKDLTNVISEIFENVNLKGDSALFEYALKFDGVDLVSLIPTQEEVNQARGLVSEELKQAIDIAKNNIEKFHASQASKVVKVSTTDGVECWQKSVGIDKVGIYIPGGTAPLFSTILMLAIPAKLAGCKEIVLCTPPSKEGKINEVMLYVADLLGIDKIFKIGGAQAVAAMTLGTESVPQVYKIFGPGNQYVTAAKQYSLNLGVAIDMPAGPSELLVVCDANANPAFVASDLLSQAEHGIDSQVICLSDSENSLYEVIREVQSQVEQLSRKDIAKEALKASRFISLENRDEIVEFSNLYAPEHLIINTVDEDYYIENISNAGSVFLGQYTPESAGDYASGTNHTLPTNGFAKQYSGVNLDAFVKKITFQRITKEGIQNIGPAIESMAEAEELQAHKNAVTLRLKSLS